MANATEVAIPVQRSDSKAGRKLFGMYFSSQLSSKQFQTLYIHGLGSSPRGYINRAEITADNGSDSLIFSLSHPGLEQRDYFAEVVAAYDWLSTKEADKKVAVCGASYGAFLAVLLSTIRTVDHLLLRAPVLVRPADAAKIENALAHFNGSLWLVLSEYDESSPLEISDLYWNAAHQSNPKEKITIPNADHGLHSDESKKAFLDILELWIQSL